MPGERIFQGVGFDLANNDIKDLLLFGVTNANLDTYLGANTRKIAYDTTNNQIWFYNGTAKKRLAIFPDDIPTITSIGDLSDVTITSPSGGNLLVYDNSDSKWKNRGTTGDVSFNASGSTTISNNAITTAKITDGNVTLAKIANIAEQTILARPAGPAGPPTAMAAGDLRTMINAEPVLTKGTLSATDPIQVTSGRQVIGGSATITHLNTAGNKHIPSGGSSNQILIWSSDGTVVWGGMSDPVHGTRGGGTQHAVATTGAHGFMSSTDKSKLDGISANANNYVHNAHTGDVTTPGSDNLATTVAALQGRTLTMSGSSAFTIGITLTNNTTITLPTTGTLATLGNAETFSGNKTFSGTVTFNGNISGTRVITSSTGLSGSSTDLSVPTAKCVYDHVNQMVALGVAWRLSADALFNNAGASLAANTNSIDNVTVAVGTVVLVKNSSTPAQVNRAFSASGSSGSWTWNPVYFGGTGGTLDPADGYMAWIKSGTANADTKWAFTGTEWIQMGGTGTYSNGTYISITNNVIDIAPLAAGSIIARKEIGSSGPVSSVVATANGQVLKVRNGEIMFFSIFDSDIDASAAISWSKIANGANANRLVTTGGASGALSTLAAGTAFQFLVSGGSSMASWSSYTMPSSIGSGDIDKVFAATTTSSCTLKTITQLLPSSVISSKRVDLASAGDSYTCLAANHPFASINDIVLWRFDSATNTFRKYMVDFWLERVGTDPNYSFNVKVNSNTAWSAGSYLIFTGNKYTATDPIP